jgi:hypothetical protein
MGQMKNYQLLLIERGATNEQQEAIEWAMLSGWWAPRLNLAKDRQHVDRMLPVFLAEFRRIARQNEMEEQALRNEFTHAA